MSDLRMSCAWHIQNLIEQDDDCQVCLVSDAEKKIGSMQVEINKIKAELNTANEEIESLGYEILEANNRCDS